MLLLLTDLDQLLDRFNTVRFLDNDRVRQALELEYTYESNRIEGNTLTLRETDLVINEGLTIGGKPLKDHLEAINHRDAVDYVKDIVGQRIDFSQRVLLDLHSLVLRGIDRDNAGRYRSVPVLIRGSQFAPPQPYLVPVQMEGLFRRYETEAAALHPVVLAAELHERIVTIHPFIDGNGRTARLVMNLTLLRHGYQLAILKGDADSRLAYYQALETAQTTGDKTNFIQMVAETVQATLERLLRLL